MSRVALAGCAIVALLLLGGCGNDDSPNTRSVSEPPREPKIIRDAKASADWVSKAMRSSGYETDFSPASLWEIDRFFADQMKAPGRPVPGGLLAEDRGSRLFAIGAYLGEVVRRNAGGWVWSPAKENPDDELGLRLIRRDGTTIWPIQRAMKRFREGQENGIAAYAAAVANLDVGDRPD